jgi:hypothetical protein
MGRLKAIHAKLDPEVVKVANPLPPPKHYEPPRAASARRSGAGKLKSEPGPPMALRGAAVAGVRLIVWCLALRRATRLAGCRECGHQVEPDPARFLQAVLAQQHIKRTVIEKINIFHIYLFALVADFFRLYGLYDT